MRKNKLSILLAITLFLSLFSVVLPATDAQAKVAEKAKTIRVDLNGDNKKETLTFKPTDKEYDEYHKLLIYVNGKKVKTLKVDFYSYEYRFITVKGTKFLYVHSIWNNDDGIHQLFRYKNKKLTRAINFDTILFSRWINNLKAKGNELRITMSDNGVGIGLFRFRVIYTYQNGTFRLKSKTHKVLGYLNAGSDDGAYKDDGVTLLTVSKEFKIYSDQYCKEEIGTVPVGAKVKLTKMFCTGNYETGYSTYYITGDGYSGWYTSKDLDWEMIFEGVTGVA